MLKHTQQQAQLGDLTNQPRPGSIRRLQQQVLGILGATGARTVLVLIEPVAQALGILKRQLQLQ